MTNRTARERAEAIAAALGPAFRETRVPMIAIDLEGKFVSANGATIRQYGYSLEELLTMTIHDLQASERDLSADLAAAARGGETSFSRRPHRCKDGRIRWVAPAPDPIDVCGERVIVSVLNDVTAIVELEERRRADAENTVRERQVILDAITAMLSEREVEPAMHAVARALAEVLGGSTSVWITESPGSRFVRLVTGVQLSGRGRRARGEVRVNVDGEKFARLAWETGEAQLVTRAATSPESMERETMERLDIERALVAPFAGQRGLHGLIYARLAEETDIARATAMATTLGSFAGMILEAVQLEAHAKRDAERVEVVWQAASERLSDGVALLDRERRIVRMNAAERARLGVDGSVLGRRCDEVFPLCAGASPCPHEVAIRENLRLVREFNVPTPIRIEIIPAGSDGADIAAVHVSHDLTDERAIRSRLITADRLATIGRLAAGVAHEVNNPAAFVTVNLGVLKERFTSGDARTPEVIAMLSDSLAGMDRIRDIVRDLKGFARERSRDHVDVSQVVASALRIATHEMRGRARVERQLPEGIWAHVRGARLAQVVLNLVVNAAQAIPPGAPADHKIVVATYKRGNSVFVEVSDTGPGVPDAIAEKIFDPFFTTREASGGTGLGLWLARGILEEEGGSISLVQGELTGATFRIELPASPASKDADGGESSGSSEDKASKDAPPRLDA